VSAAISLADSTRQTASIVR